MDPVLADHISCRGGEEETNVFLTSALGHGLSVEAFGSTDSCSEVGEAAN